eukprot:1420743-Prymnesium_polylepis.1
MSRKEAQSSRVSADWQRQEACRTRVRERGSGRGRARAGGEGWRERARARRGGGGGVGGVFSAPCERSECGAADLLFRLVQVAEEHLKLVEQRRVRGRPVVRGRRDGRRRARDGQLEDGAAELGDHEELLHQRVEVARGAEVAQPDVAAARLLLRRRHVVPRGARARRRALQLQLVQQ